MIPNSSKQYNFWCFLGCQFWIVLGQKIDKMLFWGTLAFKAVSGMLFVVPGLYFQRRFGVNFEVFSERRLEMKNCVWTAQA